jgi:hypothetical protein
MNRFAQAGKIAFAARSKTDSPYPTIECPPAQSLDATRPPKIQ